MVIIETLPPRGTGLQKGTARKERGLGVPLTEEERLVRHEVEGVPSNLKAWWSGLTGWQKVLVVLASLGGIIGGAAVLKRA